eukprot:7493673-Pyramimonas_sp.AAC.1
MEQTVSWYVCDRPPFDIGGPSVARIASPLRRGGVFWRWHLGNCGGHFLCKACAHQGAPFQFCSDPSQM